MLQDWKNVRPASMFHLEEGLSKNVIETIDKVIEIIKNENPIDETLEEVCSVLPGGWSWPDDVMVRISYKENEYTTPGFRITKWGQTERFSTVDGGKGAVDVFYSEEKPKKDAGPFLYQERILINRIARLLAGYLNRIAAARQHSEPEERLKELTVINQATRIINESKSISDVLQQLVFVIPEGWQYPDFTVARVTYGPYVFTSEHFIETEWVQTQRFQTIDGTTGAIDIFYTRDFSYLSGDPFLLEERDLLAVIVRMITDYLNNELTKPDKAMYNLQGKETKTINEAIRIINKHKSPSYTLSRICDIIPQGMQHPKLSVARITYNDKEFTGLGFRVTPWVMKQTFRTIDGGEGSIEVFYLKEIEKTREELFLNEEHDMVANLARLITGYLNSIRARNILIKERQGGNRHEAGDKYPEKHSRPRKSKHLLQNFMHKNNALRDIYHDLMPFKVKEILLVANLYDAYTIEQEGRFTEHMVGGFHLQLASLPRVTGVTTYEEASEQLNEKHFDLIIIMVGIDKKSPLKLSSQVKAAYPYIPIFLLLNDDSDIPYFESRKKELGVLDEIFVWNGDSKIFSAMITYLEDKVNVENDTQVGLARVILLVEDSVKYYSKYLPLLYSSVFEQTKRIIEDVGGDELYANLRLRARPKVLLCRSYEEALDVFNRYKEYLLCLISDVQFYRNGRLNASAGFALVNYVKKVMKDLPVIIQSSKIEYSRDAYELKTVFINKNSESLLQDIKTFISYYLGFGNFVYKDANGKTIAVARNLKEFERNLSTVPVESIVHHARRNHFSLWLMARGEIKLAKVLAPYRISDFDTSEHLREYLIEVIRKYREEQKRGKILDFDEVTVVDENNVVSLVEGSLGGKGRGLAFINTLLFNFDFETHIPGINIRMPRTTVIGTNEFEYFLENNGFKELYFRNVTSLEVKKMFLNGNLSQELTDRLERLLDMFGRPLAIRSSGMLEDSMKQPFAGVYDTYILPNAHPDKKVRLKRLTDAVKLVYASVFTETARAYIEAVDFKIEEEKMAVVIQEVVGNKFGETYYPHISGVAQSYNFYSFGHMNPEDGFAVLAIGLGKYVVDGEKAYRFCPVYPELDNNSPDAQIKNTQTEFYAVDLSNRDIDLLEGEIAGMTRLELMDAEKHGTLNHCASVYDPDDNAIYPGIDRMGPRIINFANILKYNYIPLGKAIEVVLDVVKEAIGTPVEIEFAVDLKKDEKGLASFYLLQIKPLLGSTSNYRINMDRIQKDKILLYTEHGMGNGKISDVSDVIFVDIENFDKSKTVEMAKEIEQLNTNMKGANKKYVLIGPGRWGTRDKWIGIPVVWAQISNARVIVETSLEDYPLEASGGSHFFHNVTSMRVGYFSIQHHEKNSFINWEVLNSHSNVTKYEYFKHVHFDKPLVIRMDGRKRKAVITFDE